MMSPLLRARALGGVLAAVLFGLGIVVGRFTSPPGQLGTTMIITATDRIPRELERLHLTPVQRPAMVEVLRRGSDRVMRVVDAFHPQMQAAVDSTDAELRLLLSDVQRASFDSARRVNGPVLRRKVDRAP